MSDLYELWTNYPNHFEMLAEIEGDSFNTFKPNKTIKQIKQEFENGKKPKKKKRSKQISIFD